MLPSLKLAISHSLEQAIKNVCGEVSANIVLERPKVAAHGDLATNVAMQLAKPLKRNPRELAQALIDALTHSAAAQDWLHRAELAGPVLSICTCSLPSSSRSCAWCWNKPGALALAQRGPDTASWSSLSRPTRLAPCMSGMAGRPLWAMPFVI
jgi:hypothetical protein